MAYCLAVWCLLFSAYCLLPTVKCLLIVPNVWCILFSAYCLVPTVCIVNPLAMVTGQYNLNFGDIQLESRVANIDHILSATPMALRFLNT